MKRYKPLVDGMWLGIIIPVGLVMLAAVILSAILDPTGLTILIPTALFVGYFLIGPFFGYVELREETLFIKYGCFLKREIPYKKVRAIAKTRGFYSESMQIGRAHV